MKKIIFLLAILLLPLMVSAIEDEVITVTVGEIDAPVYNVEITWGNMEFTYNEEINYIWNNTTHVYEFGEPTYEWTTSNNTIDITNKSYVSIEMTLNYNSINKNINGNFDITNKKMKTNDKISSKLILDGKLSSDNTDYVKIGFIDLIIS